DITAVGAAAQIPGLSYRSGLTKIGSRDSVDVLVSQVSKTWGSGTSAVPALDQVSHVFGSRRFTCILGPSGCGKSTLIQIIGGLETASGGEIQVRDPARPDASRALGADSVMVWQNLNLFPWRSVIDNVAFGLEMRGVPRPERYRRARALIASVGLTGFEDH